MKRALWWAALIGCLGVIFGVPAYGQELTRHPIAVTCADKDGVDYCILTEAELDRILAHNNMASEALVAALKKIEALEAKVKAPPKCAETTITEPSKSAPPQPLKKKLPLPVKPERDS